MLAKKLRLKKATRLTKTEDPRIESLPYERGRLFSWPDRFRRLQGGTAAEPDKARLARKKFTFAPEIG